MINETILQLIEAQLGLDAGSVNENMDLLNDLGADSIDLVEIVMRLEKQFKIAIEPEEQALAQKISAIIDLVKRKI